MLREASAKWTTADTYAVIEQLHALTRDGLNASEALEIASAAKGRTGLAHREIYRHVRRGRSLSGAFHRTKLPLEETWRAVISAGEASGNLPESLSLVFAGLEESVADRKQIRGALAYPCSMVLLAGLTSGVTFKVIGPVLEEFYQSLGVPIEFPLNVVIGLAAVEAKSWLVGLTVVVGVATACRKLAAGSSTWARHQDAIVLKLPIVGRMVASAEAHRLLGCLGSLLGAGVDLDKALSRAAATVQNAVLVRRLKTAKRRVAAGTHIEDALAETGLLTERDLGALSVARKSGRLAEQFRRVGQNKREERQNAVRQLARLFEPLAITMVAIVVGFAALATYRPLVSAAAQLQNGFSR